MWIRHTDATTDQTSTARARSRNGPPSGGPPPPLGGGPPFPPVSLRRGRGRGMPSANSLFLCGGGKIELAEDAFFGQHKAGEDASPPSSLNGGGTNSALSLHHPGESGIASSSSFVTTTGHTASITITQTHHHHKPTPTQPQPTQQPPTQTTHTHTLHPPRAPRRETVAHVKPLGGAACTTVSLHRAHTHTHHGHRKMTVHVKPLGGLACA